MSSEEDISWYHGKLSRDEAEELVKDLSKEGSFLVRQSITSPGEYVLTLLHKNEVIHYQIIRHGEDAFFSIDEEHIFHGLETLIDYYKEDANGFITKLDEFCVRDPPPHDTRRHGRTNLLHRATKEGNYAIVSGLLKCLNRSIEAKNQDGQTAAHLASKLGKDEILQKLIERGANINSRDTAGYSPLHYACQSNLPSTVRLLIQEGQANIQCRNTDSDWVPLHEAASRGLKNVVSVLLSLNAPAHPRTRTGETPAMLAEKNGYTECASVLRNYKAPLPKLKKSSWYHGTLDRKEAVTLLQEFGNKEGSYLVRYSGKNGGIYVLTMIHDNHCYNFQISQEGNNCFIDNGPLLESLEHVVDYYSTFQDGLPAVLLTPVPPKPKPPLPEFPRHGLSATLPLKKKTQKARKNNNNENNLTLCKNKTDTTRRSSSPLIISPTTPSSQHDQMKNSICKTFGPIVKNSVAVVLSKQQNTGCGEEDPSVEEESCYISQSRLKLDYVLGEGEFGSVYKGTLQLPDGNQRDVAVKTLHDEHLPFNRTDFIREAKVMIGLNHHCVVKLIGLSQGSPLMMVQELVPLGSMLAYLLEFPDRIIPSYDLKLWASQIACGMTYLEEQRFVHRDLAARNILLSSRHQAKISDFGLSRIISSDREYYRATVGGRWPIKWYAPESFNYGTFSHASDVWSFGVTLWEMFSLGQQPYGDMKGADVIKLVENGERLPRPDRCPEDVYRVMEQCWNYQSRDRPTFAQLLETFSKDPEYTNIKELVLGTNIT